MGNQYPMLSPWIEDIMSKATEHFKSDPYVKDYYQKAQENQAIMNDATKHRWIQTCRLDRWRLADRSECGSCTNA